MIIQTAVAKAVSIETVWEGIITHPMFFPWVMGVLAILFAATSMLNVQQTRERG